MVVSLLNRCSDDEFLKLVQESFSINEIEERLGYNSYSGSVATKIRERIKELNIDISHFTKLTPTKRTEENIFIENSTANQSTVRKWYKEGNYTEYKCSICGMAPEWQGKPLTLILDHKNGKNHDDRLENLHWVCPNCNQQLETTGSKNQAYKTQLTQTKKCVDCGKIINYRSTRCKACAGKLKSEETILPCGREELKEQIRTIPFRQIGVKYGVSDNAIRKWCLKFNLPSKVSEIKKIDDDTWKTI